MKRVHLDFTEIDGWQVLVLIDIHSKWIEAVPLSVVTTVSILQSSFSNFGLPKEIVTDNGPQFADRSSQIFVSLMELSTHMHSPHPIIQWDCRMGSSSSKASHEKDGSHASVKRGDFQIFASLQKYPSCYNGTKA